MKPHTVPCPVAPTERLARALAQFGLAPEYRAGARPAPRREHLDALRALQPGALALVTGPSGCGKSTLLGALAAALRHTSPVIDAAALLAGAPTDRPITDITGAPLGITLRALARAGLADVRLWARSADQLSDGERARLSIALALLRARALDAPWVLLDGFAEPLDAPTARTLAICLARRETDARLICASSRDDLAEALAPDLTLDLDDTPQAGEARR